MSFRSSLEPGMIVYDDNNAGELITELNDPRTPFSGGYSSRNYESRPLGCTAPQFSGDIIARDDWDEHIERQEREQSSPDHWRKAAGVPVLDQNGLPYCWMYGVVGAIMTVYAQSGIPVPHLSATGPAAQGKRWVKRGGWAEEAIRYILEFGIPELRFWPEHSMDRSLPSNPDVRRSAVRHSIVDFEELPRGDTIALASALLHPEYPRPVTLGLNWWGHLVYAVKWVKIDHGRYGALIVNSWKESWKNRGTVVLSESKARAHEQIMVKDVKLRTAA